jgi:hypothetical protein
VGWGGGRGGDPEGEEEDYSSYGEYCQDGDDASSVGDSDSVYSRQSGSSDCHGH